MCIRDRYMKVTLGPSKQKAVAKSEVHPYALTPQLEEALHLIRDVLSLRPRREAWLTNLAFPRLLVASDAAYEAGVGTAGFLMVRQPGRGSEFRMGRAIRVPPSIYSQWGEKQTYIAQLELMAVLVAMTVAAPVIRGTRGLSLVDNVCLLYTSPSPRD